MRIKEVVEIKIRKLKQWTAKKTAAWAGYQITPIFPLSRAEIYTTSHPVLELSAYVPLLYSRPNDPFQIPDEQIRKEAEERVKYELVKGLSKNSLIVFEEVCDDYGPGKNLFGALKVVKP